VDRRHRLVVRASGRRWGRDDATHTHTHLHTRTPSAYCRFPSQYAAVPADTQARTTEILLLYLSGWRFPICYQPHFVQSIVVVVTALTFFLYQLVKQVNHLKHSG
jgi:hypothetical protein